MVNTAKRHSETDGPNFLRQAFARVHRRLAFELMHAAETITHDGERGRSTEGDWISILRSYLPNRYAVDGGIAVDSLGRTSDQLDVIIFDQQYTPALLETSTIRLIPAEAIYAVFDSKSVINATSLQETSKKIASARRLKRTSVPIFSMGKELPARDVFPIIGGILAEKVAWPGGFSTAFERQLTALSTDPERAIDCGCALSHGAFDLYDGPDKLSFGRQDAGLIYFLFRLLNKLQSIGTVPAIDWNAYAALLDG